MIQLPNPHIAVVLALTIFALGLFATERVRLESAALVIFVALLLMFSAWPYAPDGDSQFDATNLFQAFGNEALIAVCALMILGKGVETTRALQPLSAAMGRYWSRYPVTMLLAVMVTAAALSAFLNNTPIIVMLLPALVAVASRSGLSPSKVLLPVGLATIIGGMSTTIGTSTNLLVAAISKDIAGIEFGMFDFSWYVAVAGIGGVLFLWLVAPPLTPPRRNPSDGDHGREFVAMLRLRSDSSMDGKMIADFLRVCGHAIDIQHVERSIDKRFSVPLPTLHLHAGDRLSVRGTRAALKEAENLARAQLTDLEQAAHRDPAKEPKLAELLVTHGSELDGKSLSDLDFQSRFGISAVALHRPNATRRGLFQALENTTLQVGDIVLCEGAEKQLDDVVSNTRMLLLRQPTDLPFAHRAPMALGIIGLAVIVAALGLLPISISAISGVGLMLATRCLGWRQIGEALNTQVVLIIVVSLALGQALTVTGGDIYLASRFNDAFSGASTFTIVLMLMAVSAILTNIVTNNAAAVISTPIAAKIATQLGVDVTPVILSVLFGANLSFVTPIGYQTNLLVFTTGGYRFSDFVRVGLPLAILMWLSLSWLLKLRYDL